MKQTLNRRQMLAAGASVMGGMAVFGAGLSSRARAGPPLHQPGMMSHVPGDFDLPVKEMEQIIQAQGTISNGLLHIPVDRNDIKNVTLRGVHILPSFEINGDLYFEPLGDGRCAMNSDLCVEPEEVDPFIDQLVMHDITFQALHQHFYDFVPMVFFIHFRAMGDPIQIARGIKAALNATSTPFPQTLPKHPSTPLPAQEIGRIIGAMPTVSSGGVVSMDVPRRNPIMLGGIRVNPYLNIAQPVSFQPLDDSGKKAAAVPDFGMVAKEIQPLMKLMRSRSWDVGCLYNQETDEFPQLFFSHQFKVGDPIELAHEVRAGLELTDSKFM
ncbi:MAG: DUF1259 domain-containing protein [Candidatus Eremiobacteraeota bacterium]|nr:DUF1259 domain-containing protein [Candidatus Eremiobacteraeota bacterium]